MASNLLSVGVPLTARIAQNQVEHIQETYVLTLRLKTKQYGSNSGNHSL